MGAAPPEEIATSSGARSTIAGIWKVDSSASSTMLASSRRRPASRASSALKARSSVAATSSQTSSSQAGSKSPSRRLSTALRQPLRQGVVQRVRVHLHLRAGLQQRFDLARGDLAAADHQHLAARKIGEQREQRQGDIDPERRRKGRLASAYVAWQHGVDSRPPLPVMLRVLLVNDTEKPIGELRERCRRRATRCWKRSPATDALLKAVESQQPDAVIIDVDSPSRDTLEQLAVMHRHAPRPVVMFSADGDDRLIRDVVAAGVTAYVVDGLTPARLAPILQVALARFEQQVACPSPVGRSAATTGRPQADRSRQGPADREARHERSRGLRQHAPAGDAAGTETGGHRPPDHRHGRPTGMTLA